LTTDSHIIYLTLFPLFSYPHSFFPSSELGLAKLGSSPHCRVSLCIAYGEKEKMGRSYWGSSRAQSPYWNEYEARNRAVLEASCGVSVV